MEFRSLPISSPEGLEGYRPKKMKCKRRPDQTVVARKWQLQMVYPCLKGFFCILVSQENLIIPVQCRTVLLFLGSTAVKHQSPRRQIPFAGGAVALAPHILTSGRTTPRINFVASIHVFDASFSKDIFAFNYFAVHSALCFRNNRSPSLKHHESNERGSSLVYALAKSIAVGRDPSIHQR